MNYQTALGRVLGKLREQHGWSLQDLSFRVEMSRTSLWQAENAVSYPRPENIERLAIVYGLSTATLLRMVADELDGGAQLTLPDRLRLIAAELESPCDQNRQRLDRHYDRR